MWENKPRSSDVWQHFRLQNDLKQGSSTASRVLCPSRQKKAFTKVRGKPGAWVVHLTSGLDGSPGGLGSDVPGLKWSPDRIFCGTLCLAACGVVFPAWSDWWYLLRQKQQHSSPASIHFPPFSFLDQCNLPRGQSYWKWKPLISTTLSSFSTHSSGLCLTIAKPLMRKFPY